MSSETEPFQVRVPKRGRLAQRWAVMGYIFGLIREIDPKLKYTIDTFTLIGLLYSLKVSTSLIYTIFSGFRVYVWSRMWELNLKKKYGEWVVITGATDGIGLEYAKEFARKGHSLILIGRNQEKLNNVKETLSNTISESKIVLITMDFQTASLELYRNVAHQIKMLNVDIGILINNAGVMYQSPNKFLDQSIEDDWSQISVNCTGLVMITRVCLPFMVRKRKGLVVNISSSAGYRPLALMGVYSASKKFVEYFSKTLEAEYKSYNIDIQVLIPSYISTKMTKWSNTLQKPNLIFPDAKTFAKSAISTIGRSNETSGYWSHGLQHFAYDWFLPGWLYSLSSWHFLKSIGFKQNKIV